MLAATPDGPVMPANPLFAACVQVAVAADDSGVEPLAGQNFAVTFVLPLTVNSIQYLVLVE